MAYSPNKWNKHKLMAKSPKLASVLPATRLLTRDSLRMLLDRYGSVTVKPTSRSGGSGVMRVYAARHGGYIVHFGAKQRVLSSADSVYALLRRKLGRSTGLVQQTIPLATVGGRPFDVRVMVQRLGRSRWKATAKLAKVAGRGYIITNVARSGGRVLPVSTAIRRSELGGSRVRSISRRLDRIALRAVKRLHRHYSAIHTVGMDLGVDRNGKVWIIEANFKPAKSLFRRLRDKSAYRRILRYSRRGRR